LIKSKNNEELKITHSLKISQKTYEEYAYVLDFLPYGKPSKERFKPVVFPIAQVIGEKYFTLLEVKLKPNVEIKIRDKMYIGKEKERDKVDRVIGRINYDELTATAKSELLATIEEIVKTQEQRFVDFFNKAQAITPKMHSLELLPSIGKKSMWQIINEREKKPFENFKDIQERVGISNLARIIAKRILEELSGESKYILFMRLS
jgi:putative nucleotide binding protein